MTIQCAKCGTPIHTRDFRRSIENYESVSIIVFQHDEAMVCPGCLTSVVPSVVSVGVGVAGIPVPTVEKQLITPASAGLGERLKQS